MNNFSPSTDTSVGTKRFTAQALEANEYVNYSGNGSPLRYVTGMQVATHPMPIAIMTHLCFK